MTLIVDASVAIKWVLMDVGTPDANQLVVQESLAAPDLMFIECANVLRTKSRRGDVTSDFARSALGVIDAVPIRSIPTRPYVNAALAIAADIDRSAYDALYLAVAMRERATLITADLRFANAALAHAAYAGFVRVLGQPAV